MLTSRICVGITVALCVTAAPALAATPPGSVERGFGGFGSDRILSVDTVGSDRIVAAGQTFGYPRDQGWVRAWLPDGRLDPAFGANDGQVDFGESNGVIRALALDDGRIVVAHSRPGPTEPESPLITRLNRDGTLDQSFGSAGSIEPDYGGSGSFIADVVADGAGRLIVVGGNLTAHGSLYVRRYLADGSRDPGYGVGGETAVSRDERSLAEVTLTPDGGVLLSVAVDGYPALTRLSADGRLDDSFASHGSGPIEFSEPRWRQSVRRIFTGPSPVVLADGRIRVPVAFDMPEEEETRIALVGLTADGHPDLGFGFRGLAVGPRPTLASRELPDEAIADTSGSVIVAAALQGGENDGLSDYSALIRRFRPGGSIDRSFGPGWLVHTAFQGGGYIGIDQSLALLGDETLVAGEYSLDGKYGGWGSPALRTINAGYDRDDPSISIAVQGCRRALVHIGDTSGIEAVVRVNARVTRRTTRRSFRVRARRGGSRVSVRAADLAGNSSRARIRLPRC
jgi:uncharacterized delta-60 repeat protein